MDQLIKFQSQTQPSLKMLRETQALEIVHVAAHVTKGDNFYNVLVLRTLKGCLSLPADIEFTEQRKL